MELLKCCRCGSFYTNQGTVCPKCIEKDCFELSTFKNYIEQNNVATQSIEQVSTSTGILEKNLNRFLNYEGLEDYKKLFK